MAELFGVTPQTISRHLSDIYGARELDEGSTCTKTVQVQNEGDRKESRSVNIYNLDAIISVGYRVNSKQATAFRRWATSILRELSPVEQAYFDSIRELGKLED